MNRARLGLVCWARSHWRSAAPASSRHPGTGSGGSGNRPGIGGFGGRHDDGDAVHGDVHGLPADADRRRQRARERRAPSSAARAAAPAAALHDRAAGEHAVPQQLAAPALPFHRRRRACTRSACTPPTRRTTWSSTRPTRPGRCPGTIWTLLAVHTRDMPIEVTVRSAPPGGGSVQLGSDVHFTIAPVGANGKMVYWSTSGHDLLQRPADRDRDLAERLRGRRRGRRRGADAVHRRRRRRSR